MDCFAALVMTKAFFLQRHKKRAGPDEGTALFAFG